MSTRWLLALLSCACLLLLGCTQTARVDIGVEADAIRNMEAQWTAAFRARDIEKMVSSCSSDIVFMYPNSTMGVGIEALRKEWESWLADTTVSKTYSSTVDAVEVAASGDLAYLRGTGRESQSTATGLVEHVDRWVSIYKMRDGKWQLSVDIVTPMSQ